MEKVLNWFAVRTKGRKLAEAIQGLLAQGENEVLQETVDAINQGETKNYLFSASGKGDLTFGLNFGGSALNLTVTDPKGKKVISQKVDSPPFSQKVKGVKGNYKMEVQGVEVPEKNMPFVLSIAGPKAAAGVTTATPTAKTTTSTAKATGWLGLSTPVLAAIGGAVLLIIIIVLVLLLRRKGSTPSQ